MSGSASSAPREERRRPGVLQRDLITEIAEVVGSGHEARWIVEEVWRSDEADEPDEVDRQARARTRALQLARRRAAGEPLQHVLGHWGFRYLDVAVDRRALVPRPETEIVVGIALEEASRIDHPVGQVLQIADLGAGSGVITCALASELAARSLEAVIYATDTSTDSLALAMENVRRTLGETDRVRFQAGSWFEALSPTLAGELDLIVSNPPYLAEAEWPGLDPVVRDHDPYGALVAGPTGLEAIDHLIDESPHWLSPEGVLVLEIAPHQAPSAAGRAKRDGGFTDVDVRKDLTGRPRVLIARR